MKTRQERLTLFALFSAAYAAEFAELAATSDSADLTIEELQASARSAALHLGAKQLEQLEFDEATIQSAQEFFAYKHVLAQEMYHSELQYPNLEDLPE